MSRNRNVNGNAICKDTGKGPNQKRQEATSSSRVILTSGVPDRRGETPADENELLNKHVNTSLKVGLLSSP